MQPVPGVSVIGLANPPVLSGGVVKNQREADPEEGWWLMGSIKSGPIHTEEIYYVKANPPKGFCGFWGWDSAGGS